MLAKTTHKSTKIPKKTKKNIKNIVQKKNAASQISYLSLGDATIKDVAEYYAKMGNKVEILTGDTGLKSYQPSAAKAIPRRRDRQIT